MLTGHLRSFAIAALCTAAIAGSAQEPYKVIDHWMVGGTGGWDYLLCDPPAHRLYVTHGPRVEVLDTDTGKIVGAIAGLKATHGIALEPGGRLGYISDGGANVVVLFDRHTLATVATIPAGTNPDGIVYEPVTKTVWAFNGRSHNVTVIDTKTRAVVATLALTGKPEFPQADGQGHVFANIEDRNSIVRLDATSRTLSDTWPLAGCDSPSGLAIDREHHILFSVCDNQKMAVVNTDTGKELALVSIGDGPDAAGYDDKAQLAFSSNGDGTLTIVDARSGYNVLQQLSTRKGARTMSYDPLKDRIYEVSAEFGPRPDPSPANPHPRPAVVAGTFEVLVIGRQ